MATSRLTLALEAGLFSAEAGSVAVWGAGAAGDLEGLPRARTTVVATLRPAHDALAAEGWEVATEAPAACDVALVVLPRAREAARALLAEAAARCRGPVVVDGLKTDGVEAMLRDLRCRGRLSEAVSKAHGKLAVLAPGADLSDWADPGPRPVAEGFVTRPGVFSADGPDPASVLLAAALPGRLPPRIADLGAGWGYLGRAVLARAGVAELHLVEADLRALDCARANLPDPRARFHWADATALRPGDLGGPLDLVVTNPPFHAGRRADPDLGRRFIAAAGRLLSRRGALWLVANRHLPYEAALRAAFRTVGEIGGAGPDGRAYKLFRAEAPLQETSR